MQARGALGALPARLEINQRLGLSFSPSQVERPRSLVLALVVMRLVALAT